MIDRYPYAARVILWWLLTYLAVVLGTATFWLLF